MSISTLHASPVALRRLCDNLAHWAFTDFDRAHGALIELADQIGPRAPFELRLSFHRSAAFLENQWQHYERAQSHCQQAIAILESLADHPGLVEMWADSAAVHLNCRDWQSAQECLDQARLYLNDTTPVRLRAHIDCREGFLHLHLGNTNDALDRLLKANEQLTDLRDDAPLKDFYLLTLTLSGLGDLYERVNEMDKSLQAFRSVLPIVERHHLRPRLAWHYLSAGRVAYAGKDFASARASFEGVLRYAGEGDAEARTHALANLGIIASVTGEASRARMLFDQASALYENPMKPSDFTNLSKIESYRAGLLTQSGDYTGAHVLLQKAYTIGLEGQDLFHLEQICGTMAKVNEELEDYAEAYRWQLLATDYTAEHYLQLRDRDREEIEVRHQLERSRQEAQMARLRVSGLQLRALRAQMNPHFLFNVLNAIQGLITSGRNNEAETYLAKFARMMRHTLEYSELEVVDMEQEIEFLERYLEINRKLRFRERLDFQIVVSPDLDQNDISVPTMIIQPFVENAIEHGIRPRQAGLLRVEFLPGDDDDTMRCIIEDDGVGYNIGREKQSERPDFQKHRSRGMEITRDRLQLLHQIHRKVSGEFIQITDIGEMSHGQRTGTRVEVLLPILEE